LIKKIHYIWLGSNLPANNLAIVNEWKSLMPDFDIIEWNNSNINSYDCLFLKQCIGKKFYAFAADYLRLRIVNEFGGFYLDTDMKLLKPLEINGFVQFEICEEERDRPSWGYFYSIPNNKILVECLKKYDNLYFDQFKPPVIPYFLKDIILMNRDSINILPPEIFYPLPMYESPKKWKDFIMSETVGVHLWDFSWGKLKKKRNKFHEVLYRIYILINDISMWDYPSYYYWINIVRIFRIIRN
jgi:hypothetical protein